MEVLFYQRKELNVEKMIKFLKEVDEDFPVPLSEKVDLEVYARKLCKSGICYTIEKNNEIVGLISGYMDNLSVDNLAYISVLAIKREYRGEKIANKLVASFCEECKKRGLNGVHVYAVEKNMAAVNTYKKCGFIKYVYSDELRKNDLHFIWRSEV